MRTPSLPLPAAGGLLAALAVAYALSTPALARETTDTVERTFKVAPGGKLHLTSDLGDVEVVPGAGDQVRVVVERRVKTDSRDEAQEVLSQLDLDIRQQGNDVRIRADYARQEPWSFWSWRDHHRLRLAYRIEVPQRYDVEIVTGSGDVLIRGLSGQVRAKTSGGDLEILDIRGPVWGRTSGGDILLKGAIETADVVTSGGDIEVATTRGSVVAATSGGDVRIGKVGGSVKASTSGGDIEIAGARGQLDASTSGGSIRARLTGQPEADCTLSTSGGDVEVAIHPALTLTLDAKTSGGEVETSVPFTVLGKLGKSRIEGTLNGGGPLLTLRTSGGDIIIRNAISDQNR